MATSKFPEQDEKGMAGGQHGTRNVGGSAADVGAQSRSQPSKDPQLKRVHESATSDEELGRGNDTSIEDGGSRHRTQ